jgi:hypothetical protein
MRFSGISPLAHPGAFQRWALTLCIPLVALVVVGRQLYLSRFHDLSTWKGGGMGMFAANDGPQSRYAYVFLVRPDGTRDPLHQFSDSEADFVTRALEYPIRSTFLRAARAIAQENWTPMHQRAPVTVFDSHGEPLRTADDLFHLMVRYGRSSEAEKRNWSIEIQFWKLFYDPVKRRAHVRLDQTFLFKPNELFEQNPEAPIHDESG